MDASFTFLNVSAREYLHWLKEAHSSTDNWLRFEHALDALHHYTCARADANLRKSTVAGQTHALPSPTTIASSRSRRELFIVLSRQIVAQEELRLAVQSCRELCEAETLSSDTERLLAWLQARSNEAEAEVQMTNLLKMHDATEHFAS